MSDVTMGNADRAAAIIRRRKALGLYSQNALVSASGLGREGVKSAEAGTGRPDTYDKIEAWLDAKEAERGIGPAPAPRTDVDEPDGSTVTFRLRGNFGVEVTVQGPVTNLNELEAQVERLLERMERPNNGLADEG